MKKIFSKAAAVCCALALSACGSGSRSAVTPPDGKLDKCTLRFSWWGGDDRHEATLEAIELWKKSSAQEYPPAMFRLAKEYAEGTNIHQDSREAVRLWEKAAGSGNDDAMLYLGMAFEGGRLTEKNINEARRYYRMAVRKFNAEALRHLIRLNGSCPETGSAMPEDETEATYFKAEHGDVKAIYRLAKTCEEIYEDEDKRLALVRLASDLKKGRH